MSQYKVTGCIVTYNNMRTIQKTVDTVLAMTKGVDFKLFVVDNSSTDGTYEFLRDTYSGVENFEIIETGENKGFSAGQNKILERLDSKYHVIINPDIILEQDSVTAMAEYMQLHDDVGIVSPRVCFPDGRDQILGKRNPKIRYLVASRLRNEEKPGKYLREYAMLDSDLTQPLDIENATGCFLMIRTELFKSFGGFDSCYFMYFEDCDLTRSVRKTHRAVYYPQAVVQHVWGRESKKNMKLMAVQLRSMMYYFIKWRGK